MTVTARTTVAGVVGDPVRHSLSPVMHNAAFAATGLDWVYVAFPAPRGRGRAAVGAARDLGIAGLSVTMPHKADAADECDELSERAARLRSVNTVVARDGKLFGDSTDGEGLLRSLAGEHVEVGGRAVLLVGGGGAARAVALALAEAGARVQVAARRAEAAADVAGVAGASTAPYAELDEAVRAADVVVNATPLGMQGEEPAFDPGALGPTHAVVDLVYQPATTPLLRHAREAGARTVGGLGMLVHQAALAFRLWTGVEAPVDIMREAARQHLNPAT